MYYIIMAISIFHVNVDWSEHVSWSAKSLLEWINYCAILQ